MDPMALASGYLSSLAAPMTLACPQLSCRHPSRLGGMFVQRRRTIGPGGESLTTSEAMTMTRVPSLRISSCSHRYKAMGARCVVSPAIAT